MRDDSFLEKMGELTGVDMSNIWFLENGQRNTHILTLKAIAEVLEIDIKAFMWMHMVCETVWEKGGKIRKLAFLFGGNMIILPNIISPWYQQKLRKKH